MEIQENDIVKFNDFGIDMYVLIIKDKDDNLVGQYDCLDKRHKKVVSTRCIRDGEVVYRLGSYKT
ncbi:MAG: hypothetical protein ACFFG0_03505 [Candidatus Thorarchaeota archaeon]